MPLDHLKYGERIKRKIDSVIHRIESGVRDCKRRLEEKNMWKQSISVEYELTTLLRY